MSSLADLQIQSSDKRRKAQASLARLMPADLASATALLAAANRGSRPRLDVEAHPSGLRALRHHRVYVPLVEPNVLRFARMNIREPSIPSGSIDDYGLVHAHWTSPGAHAASLTEVVREYQQRHDLVPVIASYVGMRGLDSWNEPLTLIPVRHTYEDGSPTATRWMAADGTARVVGARLAYSNAFSTWLHDHPYTDPAKPWPADAATMRTFLAAARIEAARQADEANTIARTIDPETVHLPSEFLMAPNIEDWADLILPDQNLLNEMNTWMFRVHRATPSGKPDAFISEVLEFLVGITAPSSELAQWLLHIENTPSRDAQQIALTAYAITDPDAALPDRQRPLDLLDDYAWSVIGDDTTGVVELVDTIRACLVHTLNLHPHLSQRHTFDINEAHALVTGTELTQYATDPAAGDAHLLAAVLGLLYAARLRHLVAGTAYLPGQIGWLLTTTDGRAQLAEFVSACQEPRLLVRLVDTDGTSNGVLTHNKLRNRYLATQASISG